MRFRWRRCAGSEPGSDLYRGSFSGWGDVRCFPHVISTKLQVESSMFGGVFGERDGTLFPARCSFRRSSRSRCGKNGQLSRRLRSFRFPKRRFGLGRRGELYARSCLSVTSLHTRCCVAGPYVRIGVGYWPACAAPACAGMLVIGCRRQVCSAGLLAVHVPHIC